MTKLDKIMRKTTKYAARLYKEWLEHKKIIIGVDYDDTIFPWRFSSQEQCDKVIKELILCKNTGAYITIFTCSNVDRFQEIKDYCKSKGLEIDSINENPISLPYGNVNKIYANIFIDDRAGLNESLLILTTARTMYFNKELALNENETEF